MTASPSLTAIAFPPFQLDRRAGLLRRDELPLSLRPKTFAVLLYLAEHPGELVTKRALLDAVWPGVAVTEDVVRQSVGELREALGDERAAPRFIATVPRRGYRFVARLAADAARQADLPEAVSAASIEHDAARESTLVGRVRERATIAGWLRAARSGRRQVAFIAGEAGIGKTTLVDMTVGELREAAGADCRVARGQCIEHFGGGEPYLPVLDALAELCRGSGGAEVRAALRERAPAWVLRALGREAAGLESTGASAASTHEHTLHMLAASLDALAAEVPLVLVLEDLQWSDYATLDLVSVIAQRRDPARLLVLCTLRSADAIVSGHPVADVKRELVRKGLCQQILLDGLTADDVASYLGARFPGARHDGDLPGLLLDRTDGNPFFLVTLVDHLLEHGLLADDAARAESRDHVDALRTAIPEGLRAVIEPRLERLTPDERSVFEAASVVGPEFAAHAVARTAAPESELADVELVEQLCDRLARRHEILRASGESTWPDGTTSARYAFRHALYRQVAYRRIAPSALRRLHQSVGEALEAAYAGRTKNVASALAAHFDASRDIERAIVYHGEAAKSAGSRHAYREARLHLQAVLDHLQSRPETRERLERELAILSQLGWTLVAIHGWGDQEAFRVFTRTREVAERLAVPSLRLRAMESLRTMHTMRAEYATTRTLSEETMILANELGDGMAVATAYVDLGSALVHLGEYETARDHGERARALVEEASMTAISARVLLAGACVHLGRVAQARAMAEEARACASKIGIPYFSAFWSTYCASALRLLRDVERTRSAAEEGLRLASEHGFASVQIRAAMVLGWCDVMAGRAAEGRTAVLAGYAALIDSGERTSTTTSQAILIETHLACGDVTSAHALLDAAFAFVAETGERILEHELHRLRGECLLADTTLPDGRARAAEQFERALALAAERGALLFELRAATSLLRLGVAPARARVARLLARFTAENDCSDARDARRLLGV